ncbi:hypothetical protein BLNAU_56 [Blattamonas nauphoetae]|uniref:CKK domain-containing protein n=1 Tax=Blattamonas nauphoetae TaxID=2049346 RepID=A0ABQ9YLW7_9EUKA|nr:hypothetical protein BLNAU_56 [Blattamonas nauphoetae]
MNGKAQARRAARQTILEKRREVEQIELNLKNQGRLLPPPTKLKPKAIPQRVIPSQISLSPFIAHQGPSPPPIPGSQASDRSTGRLLPNKTKTLKNAKQSVISPRLARTVSNFPQNSKDLHSQTSSTNSDYQSIQFRMQPAAERMKGIMSIKPLRQQAIREKISTQRNLNKTHAGILPRQVPDGPAVFAPFPEPTGTISPVQNLVQTIQEGGTPHARRSINFGQYSQMKALLDAESIVEAIPTILSSKGEAQPDDLSLIGDSYYNKSPRPTQTPLSQLPSNEIPTFSISPQIVHPTNSTLSPTSSSESIGQHQQPTLATQPSVFVLTTKPAVQDPPAQSDDSVKTLSTNQTSVLSTQSSEKSLPDRSSLQSPSATDSVHTQHATPHPTPSLDTLSVLDLQPPIDTDSPQTMGRVRQLPTDTHRTPLPMSIAKSSMDSNVNSPLHAVPYQKNTTTTQRGRKKLTQTMAEMLDLVPYSLMRCVLPPHYNDHPSYVPSFLQLLHQLIPQSTPKLSFRDLDMTNTPPGSPSPRDDTETDHAKPKPAKLCSYPRHFGSNSLPLTPSKKDPLLSSVQNVAHANSLILAHPLSHSVVFSTEDPFHKLGNAGMRILESILNRESETSTSKHDSTDEPSDDSDSSDQLGNEWDDDDAQHRPQSREWDEDRGRRGHSSIKSPSPNEDDTRPPSPLEGFPSADTRASIVDSFPQNPSKIPSFAPSRFNSLPATPPLESSRSLVQIANDRQRSHQPTHPTTRSPRRNKNSLYLEDSLRLDENGCLVVAYRSSNPQQSNHQDTPQTFNEFLLDTGDVLNTLMTSYKQLVLNSRDGSLQQEKQQKVIDNIPTMESVTTSRDESEWSVLFNAGFDQHPDPDEALPNLWRSTDYPTSLVTKHLSVLRSMTSLPITISTQSQLQSSLSVSPVVTDSVRLSTEAETRWLIPVHWPGDDEIELNARGWGCVEQADSWIGCVTSNLLPPRQPIHSEPLRPHSINSIRSRLILHVHSHTHHTTFPTIVKPEPNIRSYLLQSSLSRLSRQSLHWVQNGERVSVYDSLRFLRGAVPSVPRLRLSTLHTHPENSLYERTIRPLDGENASYANRSGLGRSSRHGSARQGDSSDDDSTDRGRSSDEGELQVTVQFFGQSPSNLDNDDELSPPVQDTPVFSKDSIGIGLTDRSGTTSRREIYSSLRSTLISEQSDQKDSQKITKPKDFVPIQAEDQSASETPISHATTPTSDLISTQSEEDTLSPSPASLAQPTPPQTNNSDSFTQDSKSDIHHHSHNTIDDLDEPSRSPTPKAVEPPTSQPAETEGKKRRFVLGQIHVKRQSSPPPSQSPEIPTEPSSARKTLPPPANDSKQPPHVSPPDPAQTKPRSDSEISTNSPDNAPTEIVPKRRKMDLSAIRLSKKKSEETFQTPPSPIPKPTSVNASAKPSSKPPLKQASRPSTPSTPKPSSRPSTPATPKPSSRPSTPGTPKTKTLQKKQSLPIINPATQSPPHPTTKAKPRPIISASKDSSHSVPVRSDSQPLSPLATNEPDTQQQDNTAFEITLGKPKKSPSEKPVLWSEKHQTEATDAPLSKRPNAPNERLRNKPQAKEPSLVRKNSQSSIKQAPQRSSAKAVSRRSQSPAPQVPGTPIDREQALLKEMQRMSRITNKPHILNMIKRTLLASDPTLSLKVEVAMNDKVNKMDSGGHFLIVSPSKDLVRCTGVCVMTEEGELESVIALKSSMPERITLSQIQFCLHFEGGNRTFSVQPVNTLTPSTDVIVLHPPRNPSRSQH